MKTFFVVTVLCVLSVTFCSGEEPKNLKFHAVPFTAVQFNDHFWSPRLKTNREISIPHNYKWCEETGRFTNFAKAAKLLNGDFEGIYFNDSDVYKVLEGTAYSLADHPDPALEKRADEVIAWIAAAQLPNGYLNSYFSLREQDKKWTQIGKHELYCAGHLIEAAVAYKQATGKETLLNVAEKFTDHIIDVFCTKKSPKFEVPGHEEIELALIKLYQLTGQEKYLTLSKHFIDIRGDQSKRNDKISGAYQQDHLPIREQSEIVGHAVRAVYLYAGVADNAAYSGDQELINAMDRLWNDVVNKKMYITGGIGARHEGEAFGNAYELPNRTAYCETCAAIGLVFWAHRMNLLHGDAKYADVVERAMYNGVLSGVGLDGKSFFYVNPLESIGNHHRQPFFNCACCPTNV
ncbi:MAG: glycoside hydrolase family 127 protein, partial [Planctomycetaceae bacterium]|nr:glycoside hydrolase family 127 protein [Planctomycetaceae bacterium]